jgi:gamma-glutamyltranspeptidase/glutathione hydrolase
MDVGRILTPKCAAVVAMGSLLLALACSGGGPRIPAGPNDVVAENAMVASAHPLASEAGLEILRRGGNAVDAAVAVAFVLSIAEPNASGIGGGGFMIVRMAGSGEAAMIDYRETAPGRAAPEYYYRPEVDFGAWTSEGPNAVGVPGLVAGAALALEQFGTMSIGEVLQPAIRLAREGLEVSAKLNGMILDNLEKIQKYPAAAAIYLPGGLPLEPGSLLKNEDLAATFEKIANGGPGVFYEGEIAEAIAAELQRLGGVFELEDLRRYEARLREPVLGTYRGYEIISASPPTGGGTHLVELLNIMEGFDVKRFGAGSVRILHVLAEAMKMVFADKTANSGDPDFFRVPVATFTDKAYARTLGDRIDESRARFDYAPPALIVPEGESTSHLSVVDGMGNVVALTQSVNSFFASGIVVPGTGILLNNHLADFDNRAGGPNAVGPGKRPTSSMAPTILLRKGEPFLTLGSPGATRIVSALAQIIINVVDFGMSIDDAIEAPRIHGPGRVLHVEGRIPPEVVRALEALGHSVKPYPDFDHYFGGAQGILIDPGKGRLYGGADSRRDGVAAGF